MSQNVDTARRAVAAWNGGDVEGLAALFEARAELVPFRSQLEGVAYVGPPGVRRFARDTAEEWEVLRIGDPEFRDLADERVLVLGRMEGRGRASGTDLSVPAAWIMRFRDARIVGLRSYSKPEDALADAGLPE